MKKGTEQAGNKSSKEAQNALDEIVREGARKLLQCALEQEVREYLERHAAAVDEQGIDGWLETDGT